MVISTRSGMVEARDDLVDASVWISLFMGIETDGVAHLKTTKEDLLVGDLVLLEILQGAKDARHAVRLEREMRAFEIAGMLDKGVAVQAAEYGRTLRGLGWTMCTSADLMIEAFCIREASRFFTKIEILVRSRNICRFAAFDGLATHDPHFEKTPHRSGALAEA